MNGNLIAQPMSLSLSVCDVGLGWGSSYTFSVTFPAAWERAWALVFVSLLCEGNHVDV